MASISITTLSSKGQIVIPQEMRAGIKEGDKLILIKQDNKIILKKMEDFEENIEEDLKFAERTEKAWKEYEQRTFVSLKKDEFIKEIAKW